MRQGVEYFLPDGRRIVRFYDKPTQRQVVEIAERQARAWKATYRLISWRPTQRYGPKLDPRRKVYITGAVDEALRIPSFRSWLSRSLARGRAVISPVAGKRRRHDPLRFGVGDLSGGGPPRAYIGRSVLDLGDRHAHAIVDVPWNALKVNLSKLKAKAKFDPWRRALKGSRARLLAIVNPKPTGPGDRAIVEASLHVPRHKYERLKASGEFDVLDDGVLARRGRKKKATNIFVMPP